MLTAQTFNNVINYIYSDKTYDATIYRILREKHLYEDAKAHIYQQLLTLKNKDNIIHLYNSAITAHTTDFIYFFVKVCTNQLKSKTSSFYRTYIRNQQLTNEITEEITDKYQTEQDSRFFEKEMLNEFRENLDWDEKIYYDERYINGLSYREFQAKYKVSHQRAFLYTKEIKQKMVDFFTEKGIELNIKDIW